LHLRYYRAFIMHEPWGPVMEDVVAYDFVTPAEKASIDAAMGERMTPTGHLRMVEAIPGVTARLEREWIGERAGRIWTVVR
jgi:hypothetical protein